MLSNTLRLLVRSLPILLLSFSANYGYLPEAGAAVDIKPLLVHPRSERIEHCELLLRRTSDLFEETVALLMEKEPQNHLWMLTLSELAHLMRATRSTSSSDMIFLLLRAADNHINKARSSNWGKHFHGVAVAQEEFTGSLVFGVGLRDKDGLTYMSAFQSLISRLYYRNWPVTRVFVEQLVPWHPQYNLLFQFHKASAIKMYDSRMRNVRLGDVGRLQGRNSEDAMSAKGQFNLNPIDNTESAQAQALNALESSSASLPSLLKAGVALQLADGKFFTGSTISEPGSEENISPLYAALARLFTSGYDLADIKHVYLAEVSTSRFPYRKAIKKWLGRMAPQAQLQVQLLDPE